MTRLKRRFEIAIWLTLLAALSIGMLAILWCPLSNVLSGFIPVREIDARTDLRYTIGLDAHYCDIGQEFLCNVEYQGETLSKHGYIFWTDGDNSPIDAFRTQDIGDEKRFNVLIGPANELLAICDTRKPSVWPLSPPSRILEKWDSYSDFLSTLEQEGISIVSGPTTEHMLSFGD